MISLYPPLAAVTMLGAGVGLRFGVAAALIAVGAVALLGWVAYAIGHVLGSQR